MTYNVFGETLNLTEPSAIALIAPHYLSVVSYFY